MGLAGPARHAEPAEPRREPPLPWTEVAYAARKAIVLSGHVRARAGRVDAPALDGCGPAPVADVSPAVVIEARTRASLHGGSTTTTWVDPASGDVLQVLHVREGRRARLKRYLGGTYCEWTRRPARRRERHQPWDTWTRFEERSSAWPTEGPPRGATTGSFGLLYQCSTLRLDREGATGTLDAWSRDGPLRIALRAGELVHVPVDVQVGDPGGSPVRVARGRVAARRVTVTAVRPGAGSARDAEVGLLGMRSGLELFLEPGTGVPLRIEGDVRRVGHLVVRLVELRRAGAGLLETLAVDDDQVSPLPGVGPGTARIVLE